MIRIDLTTSAVTVEPDGQVQPFVTVRTLQTPGSSSLVVCDASLTTQTSESGRPIELTESIRTRSGANVLREYDLNEEGDYSLTSGRRDGPQTRTFYIRIEFVSNEIMKIMVFPSSPVCTWVVEDTIHQFKGTETLAFEVRASTHEIGIEQGDITRIESDSGVKFNRSTAWERLLEDDKPDSV